MKISSLGEFGLIEQIRSTAARAGKRVRVGIGDDAAVLALAPEAGLLATTDMLLEGIHFDLRTTDFYSLGWKSAAVNLSDIAAMGGMPRFCLTALGIPSSLTVQHIREFYLGLNACLKKFRTVLVGGDTCFSRKEFFISVTMLGESEGTRMIERSGARPGDLIYVTGTLGDSAAGLELLMARGMRHGSRVKGIANKLIEKHLRPMPRIAEGRKLNVSRIVSSMIDVSDGLSSDLGHICEQSGFGAEVFADRIPLSKELRSVKGLKKRQVEYALSGGEDYELLFTSPVEREMDIMSLRVRATVIGAITRKKGMRLVTEKGQTHPLNPGGYDHFRSGGRRGPVR